MKPEELREIRKSAGLTMADASRLFQVPYRTWQNWENGDRRVPPMAGVILNLYREHELKRPAFIGIDYGVGPDKAMAQCSCGWSGEFKNLKTHHNGIKVCPECDSGWI